MDTIPMRVDSAAYEVVTVHPVDLQRGDIVDEVGRDAMGERVITVKRPVRTAMMDLPVTDRNCGALRVGDVVANFNTVSEPERITSISKLGGTKLLVRTSGTRTQISSESKRSIYENATLVAEAAFTAPGWTPKKDCQRCSRMFRNWLNCTCVMTCGRPLDCGGMR